MRSETLDIPCFSDKIKSKNFHTPYSLEEIDSVERKAVNTFKKHPQKNWSLPLSKASLHKYVLALGVFITEAEKKEKSHLQKSALIVSESEKTPDLIIKEYFLTEPSLRAKKKKLTAQYINSIESVLEVLGWSNKRGVQEAYDGAIDLLSECGEIILKVANTNAIGNSDYDLLATEEKWEVLIKGIACAYKIRAKQRFDTITKLIPQHKRRLVKAAIIDALKIMENEISQDDIEIYLAEFASDNEPDKYIQEYAKEAMQ